MIGYSRATAPDDRPLIEVTSITRQGDEITLQGTAVAYEGTVVITFSGERGVVGVSSTQATAGGPSRGDWQVTLVPPDGATEAVIGQEEMEEGAETAHLRQVTVDLRR